MPEKSWKEMTADEKTEDLNKVLREFIDHQNGANARVSSRLTALGPIRSMGRLLAGIIVIVAVILLLFRWEVVVVGMGVVRLDRWTGNVTVCARKGSTPENSVVTCQ
jgi:hypothetical protein